MRPPTEYEIEYLRECNRRAREGFGKAALVIGPQLKAAFDNFRDAMAQVRIDTSLLQSQFGKHLHK